MRNYSASLGLAILGTIQVTQMKSHLLASLLAQGVPHPVAKQQASAIAQARSGKVDAIPHFVRLDFAQTFHTVLLVMAGVMIAAAIVGFVGLDRGVQQEG